MGSLRSLEGRAKMEKWNVDSSGPCRVENPNQNLGSLFLPDPSYMLRSSDPEEKNALIERAGPREKIFFDITDEFTVGVVTCGGLCPGLNSVIRSLVMTLWWGYGVRNIKGFKYGYEGLNPTSGKYEMLTPTSVSRIHGFGGSAVGTSRGPQKVDEMV